MNRSRSSGILNASIVFAEAFLRSGDIAAVSVVPLVQAYVLRMLFGLLSQANSYRHSRYQWDINVVIRAIEENYEEVELLTELGIWVKANCIEESGVGQKKAAS